MKNNIEDVNSIIKRFNMFALAKNANGQMIRESGARGYSKQTKEYFSERFEVFEEYLEVLFDQGNKEIEGIMFHCEPVLNNYKQDVAEDLLKIYPENKLSVDKIFYGKFCMVPEVQENYVKKIIENPEFASEQKNLEMFLQYNHEYTHLIESKEMLSAIYAVSLDSFGLGIDEDRFKCVKQLPVGVVNYLDQRIKMLSEDQAAVNNFEKATIKRLKKEGRYNEYNVEYVLKENALVKDFNNYSIALSGFEAFLDRTFSGHKDKSNVEKIKDKFFNLVKNPEVKELETNATYIPTRAVYAKKIELTEMLNNKEFKSELKFAYYKAALHKFLNKKYVASSKNFPADCEAVVDVVLHKQTYSEIYDETQSKFTKEDLEFADSVMENTVISDYGKTYTFKNDGLVDVNSNKQVSAKQYLISSYEKNGKLKLDGEQLKELDNTCVDIGEINEKLFTWRKRALDKKQVYDALVKVERSQAEFVKEYNKRHK